MAETFASLFTGGGGSDLGAVGAGLTPIWGIELDPRIAEVARFNLKHDVQVADILSVDPKTLERPDFLTASPPCPSFSAAKTNGVETALDIALAQKVAEFISVLQPRIFTLENVPAYRHSKSWALIEQALYKHGYWLHVAVINAADMGVPTTRRRLIVRAVRGGYVPQLPPKLPWVGWYEAIEDLIPDLPESQFAAWQLSRLPKALSTMLVSSGGSHFNSGEKQVAHFGPDQPAMTVLTGTGSRAKALLVGQGGYKGGIATAEQDQPALTVTANRNQRDVRAFLVDGKLNNYGQSMTVPDGHDPSFTVTTSHNSRDLKGCSDGRVVKMTPRALARFQGISDDYALPDDRTLACRIIGNACCPPVFEALYGGLT